MKTIITIMTFCLCASAFAQNNVLSTYKLRNTKWEWIPSYCDSTLKISISFYESSPFVYTFNDVNDLFSGKYGRTEERIKGVLRFDYVFESINRKRTYMYDYYLTDKIPEYFETPTCAKTNLTGPFSSGRYLVTCSSSLYGEITRSSHFTYYEIVSFSNDLITLFYKSTGGIGDCDEYIKLKRIK